MKMKLHSEMVHSKALGSRRVYRLLVPEQRPISRLPLLILLHGVHGSEVDWTEQGQVLTAIQNLLEEQRIEPMSILMPSDGLFAIGTGYLNWDAGSEHQYEAYLLGDVIPHVEQKWNVGGSREMRSICGLSMGGYASIRMAFQHTEQFASASSLSGFFDVRELGELIGPEDFSHIFQSDVQRMVEVSPLTMRIPSVEDLPKIKFDCGIDDTYISMNRQLHLRLDGVGLSHVYREYPGAHSWEYWREHIREHVIFHADVMKESSS